MLLMVVVPLLCANTSSNKFFVGINSSKYPRNVRWKCSSNVGGGVGNGEIFHKAHKQKQKYQTFGVDVAQR